MKRILLEDINLQEFADFTASLIVDRIKEFQQLSKRNESYLTAKETAAKLQISLPTLSKYCKKGILPCYRVGGNLRFIESEIDKIVNEGLRFKTKTQ
jgi:excisionase family DNA binding protein